MAFAQGIVLATTLERLTYFHCFRTLLWIFNKHKTVKKTGWPRIIYLCQEALELTKTLFAKCSDDGPIFRNSLGMPWSGNAIRIRFGNLRRKHPGLKEDGQSGQICTFARIFGCNLA